VTVNLEIQRTRSAAKLAAKLADIDGVVSVAAGDVNVPFVQTRCRSMNGSVGVL
jgi:hypothetical protein